MKSSEIIEAFKSAINAAKEAGIKSISIDDLEEYSHSLEAEVKKKPNDVAAGDATMEAYKANLNSWISSIQQNHERNLEMLRATIMTGQMALKSALLVNGGASVAMLAFAGNVWGENHLPLILGQLALSLFCFTLGVLVAAIATGLAYLSQGGFGGEFSKKCNEMADTLRKYAIWSVFSSYGLFFIGSLTVVFAIGSG